jgi:chorismate-pyruvate lyase
MADVLALLAEFSAGLTTIERVSSDTVAPVYRALLDHNTHMTLMVEKTHGCKVHLRVLKARQDPTYLLREIILESPSKMPLMYAVVRVHLDAMRPVVREEIVAAKEPIGHVLVKHNVPREVYCESLIRVMPTSALAETLSVDPGAVLYGRAAFITCDGTRALDLMEISRPLS